MELHANTNDGFCVSTDEISGYTLDYYVAKSYGLEAYINKFLDRCFIKIPSEGSQKYLIFSPSTKWQQGGILLEEERISIEFQGAIENEPFYAAYVGFEPAMSNKSTEYGPTPLIAAMRCIIASKLGKIINPNKVPMYERKN